MDVDLNGYPIPIIFEPKDGEKIIHMCRGYSTIISEIDYLYLSQFIWTPQIDKKHQTVYVRRHIGGRKNRIKIYMHREITNCPKGMVVDHINGNGLDNRRPKLRIVSHYENDHNKQFFKGKYYRGVTKKGSKFRARITIKNERLHLGVFVTPEEAAIAYDKKAIEFFGEFAVINFSKEKEVEVINMNIPF